MELLTRNTLEDENAIKLINLLKQGFEGKELCLSKIVSYEEFKHDISNFVLSIMEKFLGESGFSDKCKVDVRDSNDDKFYDLQENGNLIIISENTVKKLYDGDYEQLISIFKQLNHFKVKYDIKLGDSSEIITRILKEKLVKRVNNNQSNEFESYSEELHTRMCAKNNFLQILELLTDNKEIFRIYSSNINEKHVEEYTKYKEHLTYYQTNLFNEFYLEFDKAFEMLVKRNPEWLKYPQIAQEYFLDENNNVRKKEDNIYINR